MTTTHTSTTVLYEAAAMQAMREALSDAEKRIQHLGRDTTDNIDAMSYGRLAEALEVAEGAIFNALNLAQSHLGCSEARAAIDAGLARSRARQS